jgi:hypothetical protein
MAPALHGQSLTMAAAKNAGCRSETRMNKVKWPGHEVSNPAAFGWEWPGKDGRRYQIVVLRGIHATPTFAATDPTGNWINIKMADTWMCDGTRTGFLALMERWFAEARAAQDDDTPAAMATAHGPECTGCEHDCPLKRTLPAIGSPWCSICDDHYEASSE